MNRWRPLIVGSLFDGRVGVGSVGVADDGVVDVDVVKDQTAAYSGVEFGTNNTTEIIRIASQNDFFTIVISAAIFLF